MTCIVGLAQDGDVWIGADSASSGAWTVRPTRIPKVFRVGEFIMGYTTSFRMGQILQWHLDVPPQGRLMGDEEYMVRIFVETVRDVLKKYGFAKLDNNVESAGQFLVGYRDGLYGIDDDFHIGSYVDDFDALGSGFTFALGAMKALGELPPKVRVLKALETAAYFSGGVCAPFKVLCLRGEEGA